MKILVTGATGGLGQAALATLQQQVTPTALYALARSQEKAASLQAAGVQVRLGNYDDPAALTQAFEDIDTVLFVSSSELTARQQQHRNVVEAAQKAGVTRIVYTSFPKAQTSTSPLAADHAFTERLIESTGLDYVFLRNNWYLENEAPLLQAAAKTGRAVHAGAAGKAGWLPKKVYGQIAAQASLQVTDPAAVLEIGGPLHSYDDLLAAVGQVTDQEVAVQEGDQQAAARFLEETVQLAAPAAAFLAGAQEIVASGSLAVPATTMQSWASLANLDLTAAVRALLTN
ncbi:NAD(P)H-binding protein [Leuconostocaceae bacterium ESL0958]|nr:NAD(P)H-binding protein [Leuconostocaceae bacterium ESL0958]